MKMAASLPRVAPLPSEPTRLRVLVQGGDPENEILLNVYLR